jgi:predicted nucleotidyltransferase
MRSVAADLNESIAAAAAALKAAGAREVYLFRSAAKGSLHEDSDVDMAVSGLPPEVFFRAMGEAHDALKRPLDLIDLDLDNPFTRYLKSKQRGVTGCGIIRARAKR